VDSTPGPEIYGSTLSVATVSFFPAHHFQISMRVKGGPVKAAQ